MPSTDKEKAARPAAAAQQNHPPVPDGPLEDIFLRLDAADLARASIACTSFRGTITDRAFRRRFSRLHHPPPLVGLLEFEGPAALYPRTLHPRSIHQVSTPAARAVAGAADFTCSFLPDPSSWRIRDSSGCRLLLSSWNTTVSRDLMVCDPLHRTYFRVPQVPDTLTAGKHGSTFGWFPFLVPLPVPATAGEEKEPPHHQVVWMLQRGNNMIAFVFSSSTWEWRRIPTFCGWRYKRECPLFLAHRLFACGCFYWTSCHFQSHIVLKLDMCEMKFSIMELPSVTRPLGRTNFIVEAPGGDLGALVLDDNHSLDLYCRTREGNSLQKTREGNVGAGADWRHSRTIPLPNDDSLDYSIVGAADGYLLLQAYPLPLDFEQQTRQDRYFSLKLETLAFEELPVSFNKHLAFVHLYTNFPPLLSLPSVCNEEKTGQDQAVTGTEETSAT